MSETDPSVAVVGGGVSGLTAATFTARAGLDTAVFDAGEPIVARNAHLENVPGFPAGVNARTFLSLSREQAAEAGASFREERVTDVSADGDGFVVTGDDEYAFDYLVAASWSDPEYLEGTGVEFIEQGSKTYVETGENGRTGVDGLYAAGRLAGRYHQTVVAAGSGAEAALSLVEDSDVAFYHDWVAPEGYFTGRDRPLPPGCEEIPEDEREERERASRERMREAFADPQSEPPTMHPSVETDGD